MKMMNFLQLAISSKKSEADRHSIRMKKKCKKDMVKDEKYH